ncbi:MAG: polymer-forming cytoskeletal protein [Candidatus Buchananbacteria bacterium]
MFSNEPITKDSIVTLIGPSVRVEGDLITEGDVVVEGSVIGNLRTEKNLKVGEKAKIFANIQATNAIISGEVQGNIKIKEKLELTASAKIFGDIRTKIISMAAGASLNGKCLMDDKRTKSDRPESIRQEKIELEDLPAETPTPTKSKK